MKKSAILLISTLIMAFIGGYFDVYSLLYRGGKFAFLQTGNLLNLAIDIKNGDIVKIGLGLILFICFIGGLIGANLIKRLLEKAHKGKYSQLVLLVLMILLLIPNYFFEETIAPDLSYIAIGALGFIGGILLESFRNYFIPFTATMMTNNCKLMVDSFMNGIFLKDGKELRKGLIYVLIILAFLMGVVMMVIFSEFAVIMPYTPVLGQILLLILVIFEFVKFKEIEVDANEE